MKTQSHVRPHRARRHVPTWPIMAALALLLLAPALSAVELSCEQGENAERGCCCFLRAHTYRFQPMPVSQLQVTFDTGRGIDCRSQVAIQVLAGGDWQTLQNVDAVSSSGRSETHRLSGTLQIGDTLSGVRIDDGGRCYIDYSKIVIESSGAPGQSGPGRQPAPAAGEIPNGSYRVESFSDRAYTSTWQLEVSGERIDGTSEWECCPGRRTDPLEGWVRDGQVRIARSCTGQGASGRCLQVYDGKITGPEGGQRIEGTWTHNDRFAGWWRLDLADLGTQAPPATGEPKLMIVADPAPPYRTLPVTIEFTEKPPVKGGVWWLDDRRMTNADMFFWTFGQRGSHEVELRKNGQKLARLTVDLGGQPGVRLVKIVPDQAPPWTAPATVVFRQQPQPLPGGRWFLDGRRMSDNESFSWRFDNPGEYRVVLKTERDVFVADYEVSIGARQTPQAGSYSLWGKRTRGQGAARAQTDTRELELDRSAEITEIKGSAGSYCIWSLSEGGAIDHRVLCGSKDEPVVGAILLPGRYLVMPDLAATQRASEVTIRLRAR